MIKVFALIGGKKLIGYVYQVVIRPELERLVHDTESEVDDNFLKVLDKVLETLTA